MSIKVSLQFVPEGTLDNQPELALVLHMDGSYWNNIFYQILSIHENDW